MHQTTIIAQLSEWRLLPEPERFTELYFTDYKALPKSFTAGSQQTIAFTVHNLEHQSTVYHYRLIATSDVGAEQDLGNGTFMLDHDGTHLGSSNIIVPAFGPQLAIKVELHYSGMTPRDNTQVIQTQFITFWAAIADTNSNTTRAYEYVV